MIKIGSNYYTLLCELIPIIWKRPTLITGTNVIGFNYVAMIKCHRYNFQIILEFGANIIKDVQKMLITFLFSHTRTVDTKN